MYPVPGLSPSLFLYYGDRSRPDQAAEAVLAIPYPVIDPVALQLGPLSVKWYGLAYIAGLLLGWLYIKRLLDQRPLWAGDTPPLEPQRVDDLLIYMTAGVLLGGRLGYVLFYEPRYFFMNPL